MVKMYKIPVVLTKSNEFGEVLYDAQGVGDNWDLMSNVYENEQDALKDIAKQLTTAYQEEFNNFGKIDIPSDESVDLEDNQVLKHVGIALNV